MFGVSLFSKRVRARLAKSGWDAATLLNKTHLIYFCEGLKANGYSADAAASLLGRVFTGDEAAALELRSNTGAFGALCICEDGYWNIPFARLLISKQKGTCCAASPSQTASDARWRIYLLSPMTRQQRSQ
jgi:hypothetical protein